MRFRTPALLAALVLAASCGDDGPNDPSNTSGTFSFNFAGTMISGSYSASGTLPSNGSTAQSWAAGFVDETEDLIGVVAVSPRVGATGRYDMAILAIDQVTEGTSSVDVDCDPEGTAACSGMVLWYNISDAGGTGEVLCGLETGSITVASLSATRITGSFSGSGSCINQDDFEEGTFTVTNGSFSVARLSDPGTSVMIRSR